MESDNMKDRWNEENKQLDRKVKINEDALKKKSLDQSVSEFDSLLSFSILGRYLALVYFVTSVIIVIPIIDHYVYSVPALLGGLAMLWSFFFHRNLKKPKYESMSVVELQKQIWQFRIYTTNTAKYDLAIVLLWLFTLAPAVLKKSHDFPVYATLNNALIFIGVSLLSITAFLFLCRRILKTYDRKLKASEEVLQILIDFEKE